MFVALAVLVIAALWAWSRWLRYARAPRRSVPPPPSLVLTLSASEMARGIKSRRWTSEELVRLHIARIEQVNPLVNAVVKDRFARALAEAAAKDAQLEAALQADDAALLAALPPFHGVPCTIKECFKVEGMPNASGLHTRRHLISDTDAPAVAAIKQAGFVVLGVTNTSELCMWWESNNTVYGRTNNPYDLGRIVGGSSGGEGCVVAACGSPLGLGSDIGGSIRMPAFFNGVFGHKPSPGIVPNEGQHPCAENAALRYLCTGPICRRAEDLYPMLRVLAFPGVHLKSPALVDWHDTKVFDATACSFGPRGIVPRVDADLQQAHARVTEAFWSMGAEVEALQLYALGASMDMWSACLHAAGGKTFHQHLSADEHVRLSTEMVRYAMGRSNNTIPALFLALVEGLGGLSLARRDRMVAKCKRLRARIIETLGDNGILLLPSHPSVAPRHNIPLTRPLSFVYTAVVNVLELPATQIPLGLNADGLPLGIQVVAGPGNDHLCIAAALELERVFGGWRPPLPSSAPA